MPTTTHTGSHGFICPHCGEKNYVQEDYEDNSSGFEQCDHCNKVVYLEANISIEYVAREIKKEEFTAACESTMLMLELPADVKILEDSVEKE